MPNYIPISKAQETLANAIDIVSLLRAKGKTLKRSGSEWLWTRHRGVTARGNQWYSHYTQRGGCAIDFVREFYGMWSTLSFIYLLRIHMHTVITDRLGVLLLPPKRAKPQP